MLQLYSKKLVFLYKYEYKCPIISLNQIKIFHFCWITIYYKFYGRNNIISIVWLNLLEAKLIEIWWRLVYMLKSSIWSLIVLTQRFIPVIIRKPPCKTTIKNKTNKQKIKQSSIFRFSSYIRFLLHDICSERAPPPINLIGKMFETAKVQEFRYIQCMYV